MPRRNVDAFALFVIGAAMWAISGLPALRLRPAAQAIRFESALDRAPCPFSLKTLSAAGWERLLRPFRR